MPFVLSPGCVVHCLQDPNAIKPPCAADTLPFGLANTAAGNYIGVCTNFNDLGVGSCV